MNNKVFYTYMYLRECDSVTANSGTPYYVGKGKGNRAFTKNRTHLPIPKNKSNIIFSSKEMYEWDAFQLEILLIYMYGRKDLGSGILLNKTDGGEGPSNWSPQSREKMRQFRLGKKQSLEAIAKTVSANKGSICPEDRKIKIGEGVRKASQNKRIALGLPPVRERNPPKTRKPCSEETKLKISLANKGKKRTLQQNLANSQRQIGFKPSEETRKKLSEAMKRRIKNGTIIRCKDPIKNLGDWAKPKSLHQVN